MKPTLVRYRTRPESAEENQRLIEKVFEELREMAPPGLRYISLRLADGAFVHLAIMDSGDASSPLPKLEAFRAFQSGIRDRCIEPPQVQEATIIGHYRMFEA